MARVNHYRREVLKILESVISSVTPLGRILDFGAGDGYFAYEFDRRGVAEEIVAVDVTKRSESFRDPLVFDGGRLPFEDGHFDLVYCVDVIHHCKDPRTSLEDLLRCSNRFFLIKDHNYQRLASWMLLCCLDELGNRRFGIPCLYKHQRRWEWSEWIKEAGFELVKRIHPARCHTRFYDRPINTYEFVALWQRTDR